MLKRIALITAAAFVLTGCAAAHVAISKRDLDVQTKMSDTVFLDPVGADKRNRSLSGVLCPPAPTRNNPSHIHQGGAGSDQGDSDQQQVAAA